MTGRKVEVTERKVEATGWRVEAIGIRVERTEYEGTVSVTSIAQHAPLQPWRGGVLRVG